MKNTSKIFIPFLIMKIGIILCYIFPFLHHVGIIQWKMVWVLSPLWATWIMIAYYFAILAIEDGIKKGR